MACGEPWKTMAGQDMFVLLVYVYIYIWYPPPSTYLLGENTVSQGFVLIFYLQTIVVFLQLV